VVLVLSRRLICKSEDNVARCSASMTAVVSAKVERPHQSLTERFGFEFTHITMRRNLARPPSLGLHALGLFLRRRRGLLLLLLRRFLRSQLVLSALWLLAWSFDGLTDLTSSLSRGRRCTGRASLICIFFVKLIHRSRFVVLLVLCIFGLLILRSLGLACSGSGIDTFRQLDRQLTLDEGEIDELDQVAAPDACFS
jgi:hypothetical protein